MKRVEDGWAICDDERGVLHELEPHRGQKQCRDACQLVGVVSDPERDLQKTRKGATIIERGERPIEGAAARMTWPRCWSGDTFDAREIVDPDAPPPEQGERAQVVHASSTIAIKTQVIALSE